MKVVFLVPALLLAACRPNPSGTPSTSLALEAPTCALRSETGEIGKPSALSRTRLTNGWKKAPKGSLGLSVGDHSFISVDLGLAKKKLALRFASEIAEFSAAIGPTELEVEIEGRLAYLTLPEASLASRATIDLELPFGTEVVDARVLSEARPDSTRESAPLVLVAGGVADCSVVAPPGSVVLARVLGKTSSPAQVRFAWSFPVARTTEAVGETLAVPFPGEDTSRAYFSIFNIGNGSVGLEDIAIGMPAKSPARPVEASELGPKPKAVVVYVMDALQSRALERLPESEISDQWREVLEAGFEFQNHHSVAPNTLPSTKALFTGHIWKKHGGRALTSDAGPTMAENFESAGFSTAMFSNNPYVSRAFGVDRGFQHVVGGDVDHEKENTDAEILVGEATRWLDRVAGTGTSVFLYVHVLNPHNPYLPPSRFTSWIPKEERSLVAGGTRHLLDLSRGKVLATDEEVTQIRNLYIASVLQGLDSLSLLRESLLWHFSPEEVLLVVTSDHGEEIGEHGSFLHGYTLFEEMLHIPALLHWPGEIVPGSSGALTTTLDLGCYLRSVVESSSQECRMNSILAGVPVEYDFAFAAAASVQGGIFSIRDQRYKLIFAPQKGRRWGLGTGPGRRWDSEYFFDLANDPMEHNNLLSLSSRDPAVQVRLEMLQVALHGWVMSRDSPVDSEGSNGVISDELSKRLRTLGYVTN